MEGKGDEKNLKVSVLMTNPQSTLFTHYNDTLVQGLLEVTVWQYHKHDSFGEEHPATASTLFFY